MLATLIKSAEFRNTASQQVIPRQGQDAKPSDQQQLHIHDLFITHSAEHPTSWMRGWGVGRHDECVAPFTSLDPRLLNFACNGSYTCLKVIDYEILDIWLLGTSCTSTCSSTFIHEYYSLLNLQSTISIIENLWKYTASPISLVNGITPQIVLFGITELAKSRKHARCPGWRLGGKKNELAPLPLAPTQNIWGRKETAGLIIILHNPPRLFFS